MNFERIKPILFFLFVIGLVSMDGLSAQFGNQPGPVDRFGRRQSLVPPTQDAMPDKKAPPTIEEIVNSQMPSITEALELGPFEEAVVRTTLIKYGQQRNELIIMELPPDKMREGMEKISKSQEAELKAGLPPDKFDAFVELQENYFNTKKMKKEKKKKKKKEKKDKS